MPWLADRKLDCDGRCAEGIKRRSGEGCVQGCAYSNPAARIANVDGYPQSGVDGDTGIQVIGV